MQGKHKRFLFNLIQFILVIMGLKVKLYMDRKDCGGCGVSFFLFLINFFNALFTLVI